MIYTKENPLRCFFAFEGYNSQGLALNRLKNYDSKFDWVCVGRSEIERNAIIAADALFPENKEKNYGDISKIDWNEVPDFDLFTMSSPCQDFSQAGLQQGGAEGSGTRSSLLWECRRAIIAKKPKYIVFENVKALVSAKFLPYFNKWQSELQSYGYSNFAQILNSKDYGVPQNRERIFLVSILDCEKSYNFPKPIKLEYRLKDFLDSSVDEKYYLSEKLIKCFKNRTQVAIEKGNGFRFSPTNGDCIAKTITCRAGDRTDDNFIKVSDNESGIEITGNIDGTYDCDGRVYGTKGISPALRSTGHLPNIDMFEPKAVSYSRDSKGNTINKHLNDCVNTIHTLTGKGGNTDCFIAEPKLEVVGNIDSPGRHESALRVYSQKGLSPTLNTCGGGGLEPMIIEDNDSGLYSDRVNQMIEDGKIPQETCFVDAYNGTTHKDIACSIMAQDRVLHWVNVESEPKIEIEGQIGEYSQRKVINPKGLCPTVMENHGNVIPIAVNKETPEVMTVGYVNEGKHQQDYVQSADGICRTIPAGTHGSTPHLLKTEIDKYRIRKLTEREAFRLMGLRDDEISTIIGAGIAKTNCYKLAGNSIVVDVLYHIFRTLLIDVESESSQLSLF